MLDLHVLVELFYQILQLSFVFDKSTDLIWASLDGFLHLHVLLVDSFLALLALDDFLPGELNLEHTWINGLSLCDTSSWLSQIQLQSIDSFSLQCHRLIKVSKTHFLLLNDFELFLSGF